MKVKELEEERSQLREGEDGPACEKMREDVQELGQVERQPRGAAEVRWVELEGNGGKGVRRRMELMPQKRRRPTST